MKYKTVHHIHVVLSFFIMLFCIRLGVPIIRFRTKGDISYYIAAI